MNAQSFLKVCCGIAVVVLSVAALAYTVKPSLAAPAEKNNITRFSSLGEGGKYAMQYQVGQAANGDFFWHMIISNTETGAYRAYRWDVDSQSWKAMFDNSKVFPGLP